MTDDDVWDALNDRILAKNLEKLKMAKAREDGIEKGKEEEKLKIIKAMIANGISIEQTSEILKMKISDIKKMLEK